MSRLKSQQKSRQKSAKTTSPHRYQPPSLYTCAEDLCDAYEEEGYTPPKPERRHAVRLMDEPEPETAYRPNPPSKPKPPIQASRVGQACSPGAMPPSARGRHARLETDIPGDIAMSTGAYDAYTIDSITPEGMGETVAVILTFHSVEGAGPERLKLHLFAEQYAELGIRVGEITPEGAEILLHAGRLCSAVKRGMNLLAYGDQSARRLAFKLTSKGVDRAVAEEAAAYLSEKGYIREDDTARLRAEADVRKLWGPRRIREDLRANGFTASAVDEALDSLMDVDFVANCAAVMHRKYGGDRKDRAARQKMIAALMRLGYDMDIIRAAMQRTAMQTVDTEDD